MNGIKWRSPSNLYVITLSPFIKGVSEYGYMLHSVLEGTEINKLAKRVFGWKVPQRKGE